MAEKWTRDSDEVLATLGRAYGSQSDVALSDAEPKRKGFTLDDDALQRARAKLLELKRMRAAAASTASATD